MSAIVFYLFSVVLFGLGTLCLRKTSPYSRAGGTSYEKKMTRKVIGEIIMVAAALSFGLAILTQFFSDF